MPHEETRPKTAKAHHEPAAEHDDPGGQLCGPDGGAAAGDSVQSAGVDLCPVGGGGAVLPAHPQPQRPGEAGPGGGPQQLPHERRPPRRRRAPVRAAAQRDDPGPHPRPGPGGPAEDHGGYPQAPSGLPQLLPPVGGRPPGRSGTGGPGPGRRGGVPDHGRGGDLDSAAHGAPAGQRGHHRHRHHPRRDRAGHGAPPAGGFLQDPQPHDGAHHGRPGDRSGGGHLAAAVGYGNLSAFAGTIWGRALL